MKKFILIAVILILALTGCKNKELSSLQQKHEELQEKYNKLQLTYGEIYTKYNELKQSNDKLAEDYKSLEVQLDKAIELANKNYNPNETDGKFLEAWANAVFNDTYNTTLNLNALQIVIQLNDVTENNVKQIYEKLSDNITTLAAIVASSDTNNFSIRIVDKDEYPVMEYEFFPDKTGDNIKISLGLDYANIVSNAIGQ